MFIRANWEKNNNYQDRRHRKTLDNLEWVWQHSRPLVSLINFSKLYLAHYAGVGFYECLLGMKHGVRRRSKGHTEHLLIVHRDLAVKTKNLFSRKWTTIPFISWCASSQSFITKKADFYFRILCTAVFILSFSINTFEHKKAKKRNFTDEINFILSDIEVDVFQNRKNLFDMITKTKEKVLSWY